MNNLLKATTATILSTLLATSAMAAGNAAAEAASAAASNAAVNQVVTQTTNQAAKTAAAAAAAAVKPVQPVAQDVLKVVSAVARPSITGSKNSAAYITLHNDNAKGVAIKGVSSVAVANRVEMHETRDEGGVKKMMKVDRLHVPANGDLVMKKGGIHIMLIDLKKALNVGDKFVIELKLEDHQVQKVEVTVVQM